MQNDKPLSTSPVTIPNDNPFTTLDQTVSYGQKVDVQMEEQAGKIRASGDWDTQFNIENDYE